MTSLQRAGIKAILYAVFVQFLLGFFYIALGMTRMTRMEKDSNSFLIWALVLLWFMGFVLSSIGGVKFLLNCIKGITLVRIGVYLTIFISCMDSILGICFSGDIMWQNMNNFSAWLLFVFGLFIMTFILASPVIISGSQMLKGFRKLESTEAVI